MSRSSIGDRFHSAVGRAARPRRRGNAANHAGAAMNFLYFIVVAVALYFLADRLLEFIETRRGARFEQRTILFFFLLLGLALVTFAVIRRLEGS
jgi:hypothetical protein